MANRTAIFARTVSESMDANPLVLPGDASLSHALAAMAEGNRESVLVVAKAGGTDDATGRLMGIFTERDVVRRVALRASGQESLADVMTPHPKRILGDDYLYHAIAVMRRHGLRHLPVVDRENRPIGVLRLHDALAFLDPDRLEVLDALSQESSLDGLREVKAAQVELAEQLFADSLPAPAIQQVISEVNRDIHARIIDRQLGAMEEEGWGGPPVAFCLIIMGSGGRGESFLYPDQDNGLILDDYPDEDHGRIDPFFIELSERLNRDLDRVGFPYCNGYVMARNPLWRKTRSQWRAQIARWGVRRRTIANQLADIFFDFRGAYGELQWAEELRRDVAAMARTSTHFLSGMAEEGGRTSVALGWFGTLAPTKDDPEHRGEVNLKHRGTLPLVTNLRLLALREGVLETSSLARLDALQARGLIDRDEWDYLRGAFDHITALLLRQQLADFRDPDRQVSNFVRPDALTERERELLVRSLKAIERFAKRVEIEFTGRVL